MGKWVILTMIVFLKSKTHFMGSKFLINTRMNKWKNWEECVKLEWQIKIRGGSGCTFMQSKEEVKKK
jgi:hypothetical protein